MKATPPTAKQRACPHRATSPLLDPRFARCLECGLMVRATVAAPWIIEYDETQPAPEAPELFPARDPATYIAESNAATAKRTRRKAKAPRVEELRECRAPYCIGFQDERAYRWAIGLIETAMRDEAELGGRWMDDEAWTRWPDQPANPKADYTAAALAPAVGGEMDAETAATIGMLRARRRERAAGPIAVND